jgi:hypothetical protein
MCRDLRPGGPTSLVRRAAFVALNRWALGMAVKNNLTEQRLLGLLGSLPTT